MPFTIIRNDITKMKVDAIVNAANTELQMGGGVCGAIFKAAGAAELQAACNKLAPIQTGEAVITPGFNLSSKYIIHTAGPIYRDGSRGEEKLLRSCYLNSLKLALENNCKSIAFPLISSGIYGYPKAEALRIAAAAIQDFLVDHDMDIFLVVFDKKAFVVSEKLLGDVEAFIDEIYVEDYEDSSPLQEITVYEADAVPAGGIDKLVGNLDESFSQTLLRLIKARGMS